MPKKRTIAVISIGTALFLAGATTEIPADVNFFGNNDVQYIDRYCSQITKKVDNGLSYTKFMEDIYGGVSIAQYHMKNFKDGRNIISNASLENIIKEADLLFSQDYIESRLRESIELYEEALVVDPENSYVLNRLSQACYELAYCHLFVFAEDPESLKEERVNWYEKGLKYGRKSMDLNSAPLELITDIEALHWTSCNWGMFLGEAGLSLRGLSDFSEVKAVLERAVEVDETYLYGGPLRAIGAYWANLPRLWGILGPDLEKAKSYFEESIKIAPDFLGNRAIYIQEYVLRVGDHQLLKEQVEIIRESPIHEEFIIWDMAAKTGIEKLKLLKNKKS